jgi:hypothetical protein
MMLGGSIGVILINPEREVKRWAKRLETLTRAA